MGLAACEGSRDPVRSPPAELPLAVEFAGCSAVFSGPRCQLPDDGDLVLWARSSPAAKLEVRAGGRVVEYEAEIDAGRRFRLGSRPESPVTVLARAPGAESRWTLTVEAPSEPEWLTLARKHFKAGNHDEAREILEPRIEKLEGRELGAVQGVLARLDFRSGRFKEAEDRVRRAVAAHRTSGNTLGEVNDATMLAYLLQDRRALAEADALFAELPHDKIGPSEALFYVDFHRGQGACDTGDLRTALRRLGEATRHAERILDAHLRIMAEQRLANCLERAGRVEEAAAIFGRLATELENPPPEFDPCDRAAFLNNHGWSILMALEAGDGVGDPIPEFSSALEILDADCEHFADERFSVRLNLALSHLLAGRRSAARRWLHEATALAAEHEPEPRQLLWQDHVEGLLALAEARPEAALVAWRRLGEGASAAVLPELEWRAAVGRARAHEARQSVALALESWAEAEAILERESLEVALQAGRQTFVVQRESGTRSYVDLLLRSGDLERAMTTVRRAQARVLRTVARSGGLAGLLPREREQLDRALARYRVERSRAETPPEDNWHLSSDHLARLAASRATGREELRGLVDEFFAALGPETASLAGELTRPPSGVLLLAYYPLPQGWAGLGLDGAGAAAHRIPDLRDLLDQPDELARELLAPFSNKIEAAERVRILPYGLLATVDFHTLPYGAGVLLEAAEVEYGLDLHGAGPVRGDPPSALVVADPSGDLPGALAEARRVAQTLGEAGWQVRLLAQEEASGAAVRSALSEADLFHFAGHAVYGEVDDWHSILRLANGTSLAVEDVLTLERSPALVVLSGCETGLAAQPARGESLGMAHAFLAAGAEGVVATSRPVADRHVARVVAALYDHWLEGAGMGAALRRAQLSLRQADAEAPWESFRFMTR